MRSPTRDVRMPSFAGSTHRTLSLLAMYRSTSVMEPMGPACCHAVLSSRYTTQTRSREAGLVQQLPVRRPGVSVDVGVLL